MKYVRLALVALLAALASHTLVANAQESAVAPLMKLLQSGRLPKERQGAVLEMITKRGNESDLRFVFDELQKPDAFTPEIKLQTLAGLTDAAITRKVAPSGDLSSLGKLIADKQVQQNPALLQAAIKLASVWKVQSIAGELQALATASETPESLQQVAIAGLVNIGDASSAETLAKLAASGKTTRIRTLSLAGLVRLDVDRAAAEAPAVLAALKPQDDPAPVLDAFLNRQNGAEKLAAALQDKPLGEDAAKVALRYMYSVGRSDAELSNVLSKAAGVAADVPPPTAEEVAKLVEEVNAKGDAARGEQVFRRADVNCMKCHAVAQAGGAVGPELSAVGSISPVEYIVNSILNPNLAIKEQYVTKVFLTADGEVLTGIVIDRDDERVNLKDASGKRLSIPTADIDAEKDGPSLMPQGLTKFLAHQELLDLAKFVSELGKPGPYGIRTTGTVQRWRVLKEPAAELLTAEAPNVEILRQYLLDAPADAWGTLYGMVSGKLPLADVRVGESAGGSGSPAGRIVYLQSELNVTETGVVTATIESTQPTLAWFDAEPFDKQTKFEKNLARGRHTLTLRVELPPAPGEGTSAEQPTLKVIFDKPAGATTQFGVVNGS